MRLTREFCFEMAHALHHYKGECRNIHGHSYKLSVTVIGSSSNAAAPEGMVMDLKQLKEIVNKAVIADFDHALVLNEEVPPRVVQAIKSISPKVMLLPEEPTVENLLTCFAARIRQLLPRNVTLHHLLLRETATSFAEFFEKDNLPPPMHHKSERADFNITEVLGPECFPGYTY